MITARSLQVHTFFPVLIGRKNEYVINYFNGKEINYYFSEQNFWKHLYLGLILYRFIKNFNFQISLFKFCAVLPIYLNSTCNCCFENGVIQSYISRRIHNFQHSQQKNILFHRKTKRQSIQAIYVYNIFWYPVKEY